MLIPLAWESSLFLVTYGFHRKASLGWNSAQLCFLLPFSSWLFSVLGAAGSLLGADLMHPFETAFHL